MLIEPRTHADPDVIELAAAAVAELDQRYPEVAGEPPYPVYPQARFLVAVVAGTAVGGGAVQPIGDGAAEIKRMYVRPAYRGSGIARRLLAALESVADNAGWQVVRLETGVRQPEAIALYETSGYRRIPRFGHYTDDPFSVCFEKDLREAAGAAKDAKMWHDDRS